MTLKRDSWKIVELIIMRYPEKKKEYEDYVSEIMSASTATSEGYLGVMEDNSPPQSVTEAKALKMTSAYFDRIKKEIEAVEFVYSGLRPEEQKVMRVRYWSDRRRKIPYVKMTQCSYSERQMKRIVFKIINQVGRYIGEIN